jgi:hypothetical protein
LALTVLFFGQSVSANENNQSAVGLHPATCLAALAVFSQPHPNSVSDLVGVNARVIGDIVAGQQYQELPLTTAARDAVLGFLHQYLGDPRLDVQIVQGKDEVRRKLADWVAAEKRIQGELARIPGDQPRLLEEALSSHPHSLSPELDSFHLYKNLQNKTLLRLGGAGLCILSGIPLFGIVGIFSLMRLYPVLDERKKLQEQGAQERQSRMDRMDDLPTAESIQAEFQEPGAFFPFPRVFGWITAMPSDSRHFLTKGVGMDRRWFPYRPWGLKGVGARQQLVVLGTAERNGVDEPVLIAMSVPTRLIERPAAK